MERDEGRRKKGVREVVIRGNGRKGRKERENDSEGGREGKR